MMMMMTTTTTTMMMLMLILMVLMVLVTMMLPLMVMMFLMMMMTTVFMSGFWGYHFCRRINMQWMRLGQCSLGITQMMSGKIYSNVQEVKLLAIHIEGFAVKNP